jgi:hypothetical protein
MTMGIVVVARFAAIKRWRAHSDNDIGPKPLCLDRVRCSGCSKQRGRRA